MLSPIPGPYISPQCDDREDETLVHTWHTCARMEYGVILGTLVSINFIGVPVGMLTGALLQIAVFAVQVCKLPAARRCLGGGKRFR
eukprot:SAG31_NODE_3578_length_4103_cov_1.960789_2_plen_86_part_00